MKVNPFVTRPPSLRIVIEIDAVKGTSNLKTYGGLTIPAVLDTLHRQFSTLWSRWLEEMAKGAIVTPGGLPAGTAAAPPVPSEPEPEPNGDAS